MPFTRDYYGKSRLHHVQVKYSNVLVMWVTEHAACSIRIGAPLMQARKRGKRKATAGPVLDPLEQTLVERKVGHA